MFVSQGGKQSTPVLVSFHKPVQQPLLPPMSPEAWCLHCPSSWSQPGRGLPGGGKLPPTSGSEGQMKERGCARQCRVGAAMIPESFYLVEANF